MGFPKRQLRRLGRISLWEKKKNGVEDIYSVHILDS